MKTLFLVLGKTQSKPLGELIQLYATRIGHYIPFEIEVIPELANTKSLSIAQQKEKEATLILSRIKPGDDIVLLDEGGRSFRSMDFAIYMKEKMLRTQRRLVFVVGGPYGFGSAVYAATNQKISLSPMTFSHQMIRLIFVEQVYRAMTILRNEPYHHE